MNKELLLTTLFFSVVSVILIAFQYYVGFVITIVLVLVIKEIMEKAPTAGALFLLPAAPIIIGDILLNVLFPVYYIYPVAIGILYMASLVIYEEYKKNKRPHKVFGH